jgi:hypothetical protein
VHAAWLFALPLHELAGAVVLPLDGARVTRRVDGAGTLLVLGAMGLVCAGLIQAPVWPVVVSASVLASGLLLAAAFVWHTLRHPSPVLPPRLFTVRRFRVSAVGLVVYYVGFAAMLLGTTLLLTQRLSLSVLDAAVGIAPGPITAGIVSPFSGRIAARLGVRNTLVLGAGLFGMAAAWPLLSAGDASVYLVAILPSMVLWGVANALIQPTLFAAANSLSRADLASGAAVLTMARQLGSALGVAFMVAVLGVGEATGLVGFQHAWMMVIVTAALTGLAGLFTEVRRDRFAARLPRTTRQMA